MDDSERDEILWRLDERTELIQTDIQEVKEENAGQRKAIQSNRDLARGNRRILNMMTFGIGTFVTTAVGKFSGMIKL